MWEAIMDFMSDLILFTAGLGVLIFWVLLLIEAFDLVTGRDKKNDEKEEVL